VAGLHVLPAGLPAQSALLIQRGGPMSMGVSIATSIVSGTTRSGATSGFAIASVPTSCDPISSMASTLPEASSLPPTTENPTLEQPVTAARDRPTTSHASQALRFFVRAMPSSSIEKKSFEKVVYSVSTVATVSHDTVSHAFRDETNSKHRELVSGFCEFFGCVDEQHERDGSHLVSQSGTHLPCHGPSPPPRTLALLDAS